MHERRVTIVGTSDIHIFGIRHHGPGSARSLRRALAALEPDAVLVEGPSDAQSVLPLLVHPDMKPPVALLVFASEVPSQAVFYPFATFSPEWQALSYALERGIVARFMDLPHAHQIDAGHDGAPEERDPIGLLARAAGYADRELWWEHHVEQRRDADGVFEAILEAMVTLRGHFVPRASSREAQREAYMRKTIRAAQKEGLSRIAVVCGAWHGPALRPEVLAAEAKSDAALLKTLPRTKTDATWIPWTQSRLSYKSGYGAGIASPGWYSHLWHSEPPEVSSSWISHTARLLRESGIDAPPASVIDTVRMAEALASIRGLPMPGLTELTDATDAVLCQGATAPMALIRTKLEIGSALGEVPEEAPAAPLARDVAAAQKRLRLRPTPEPKSIELDLRAQGDRDKSRFLHRLNLLEVPWGKPKPVGDGKAGTFHEHWDLAWIPELSVSLAAASIFGNTVESAANAKAVDDARDADLPQLTALLHACMVSDLPEAIDRVLGCVEERAALHADALALMLSFASVAKTTRYGDVRQTPAAHLMAVVNALLERICVGLVPACTGIDDTAAAHVLEAVVQVHQGVALLDRRDLADDWAAALRELIRKNTCHGLLRGGACRLLFEQRRLDATELVRMARLSLSRAAVPQHAAGWVEGLLSGSALLILQYNGIWRALDEWMMSLTEDVFIDMLPFVRRAFSNFTAAERRQIGERIKRSEQPPSIRSSPMTWPELDPRAALVHPVLGRILGVDIP